MVLIYLIRHAESQDRSCEQKWQGQMSDSNLTRNGVLQAKKLANFLRGENFDIVFSSPLTRCIKTSEEIINKNPKKLEILGDLKEFNFGIFEDLTKPQILDKYLDVYSNRKKDEFRIPIPGGESFEAVKSRLLPIAKKIVSENKNCLVVCHAHIVRMLCVILAGMSFDDAIKIRFQNASVTKIKLEKNISTIEYLNVVNFYG